MDRESQEGRGGLTPTKQVVAAARVRRTSLGAGLLLLMTATGCAFQGQFTNTEFGPPVPVNASVEDVVGRINANIERLSAWRSNDVCISGQSLPVHLTGTIAVERPRNFRLTAGILGMDEEADFGSNTEWFWFWVKRASMNGQPSYVYQAKHEDVPTSQHLWQIPFQPDWLMEALGVVPIDAQHMSARVDQHTQVMSLISERLSPSGQPIKKVISVDLRHGLVLRHSLHDMNGNLIASARLEKHLPDRASGVVMPHQITLDWPQANLNIKLEIDQIDVNPRTIPPRNWQVPHKEPYSPAFDIGAMDRKRAQLAGATAGRARVAPAVAESPSSDAGNFGTPTASPNPPPLAPNGPPDQFGAPSPLAPPGRVTLGSGNPAGSRPEDDGAVWNQPLPSGPRGPRVSSDTSRSSGSGAAGRVQLGSFDADSLSSPPPRSPNSPPASSPWGSSPSSTSPSSAMPPPRTADADDPFGEAPAATGAPPPVRPTSAIPNPDGSAPNKGDPFESLPH